jgi:uncharacterized membrane protein YfcA
MPTTATIMDAALLLTAGFIAGGMNAIAGGGSFVTFPALVLAGLPSLAANVSSTVALVPGTLASVYAYATGHYRMTFLDLGSIRLPLVLAVSAAGGLTGAVLLVSTPLTTFDRVIPWLLLLSTFTFAFGRRVGTLLRRRMPIGAATLLPVQFVLGIYGGYFGGAVGIMMLAVWSLLDGADPKALNPTRTMLVAATNGFAVGYFVVANEVWWAQTLFVLAGALGGGFVGARVGQRLPVSVVRGTVIAITVGMTLIFFRRAYR